MTENKRNIMVAAFVLIGLAALSWLIFKFGELPMLVSGYNAYEITIYFPEAPGIQQNAPVRFRGYPVGRVVSVKPPTPLPDLNQPDRVYYQVAVVAAISAEYQIPVDAIPKVYLRGLGGSFVEFVLRDEQASQQLLADGDQLKGIVSEASEFISESTQHKLDELIASLVQLSNDLQGQLTHLPPELVDRSDPNRIRPNITTAVMRMDQALKNLNVIIGDVENQQNFKNGMANFSTLTKEMRAAVKETQDFAAEAVKLVNQTSKTIENIDNAASQINANFQHTGAKIQNAADELACVLNHLDHIFVQISTGPGTTNRMLYDPRLYESLADASENLNIAIAEFRQLLAEWAQHGMKVKLK